MKDSARELKQGEERKAMNYKKETENKKDNDDKVSRQTSDMALDAILAEINSSFDL